MLVRPSGCAAILRPVALAALLVLVLSAVRPAAAIEITMTATVETPSRPVVHGTTNLPDGSQLKVTVSRPGGSFTESTRATVQGGRFIAGPFGAEGGDLEPGNYAVEVLMEMSAQTREVRAVVGVHGMMMEGALTKLGSTGQYIDYTFDFQAAASGQAVPSHAAGSADEQWVVDNCTTRLDFLNDAVRAKAVSGHEITGSERDAWMADCMGHPAHLPNNTDLPIPDSRGK